MPAKLNTTALIESAQARHDDIVAVALHEAAFGALNGYVLPFEDNWQKYIFDPDNGGWEPTGSEAAPPDNCAITLTAFGRCWLERWNGSELDFDSE